jgi:hypothetical protein
MGAAREKTQADFDLERFINMFDSALTSTDPRVKNALQSLMMMVILTNDETSPSQRMGPLRQMQEDMYNMYRRLERVENDVRMNQIQPQAEQSRGAWPKSYDHHLAAAQKFAQSIDEEALKIACSKINSPGKLTKP